MKPQPHSPEDRLLDDLVSTPDREDFFASVEQDLVTRMEQEGGSPLPPRRNGWIIGSTIVIGASISIAAWLLLQPGEPINVSPVAEQVQTAAPAEAPVPTAPKPTPVATDGPMVATPVEQALPSAAPTTNTPSTDPSQIEATARSSSPMAVRARREVDSLRAALATEQDVSRQLSLRYDIGVRLRIAGDQANAQRHLESLAADAHNVNADVLSARSLQQAAMAARDRGQVDRARTLLTSAIERLPADSDKLRSRWEKELGELR